MKKQLLIVSIVSLLVCSLALADVTVYRAVNRKNATYAEINNGQWRIDEDGLSTFEAAEFAEKGKAKPCKVSFTILGVSSKPEQGTKGEIQNMPGYEAEYTPQHGGPGHWSIQAPSGTSPEDFKTAITNYVITHKVASVNDSYEGKSKSKCETPDNPN